LTARQKEERVPTDDRLQIVRDIYRAFASGDRNVIERAFADDFTFSSPVDVGLDRAGYFERCWPGAGRGQEFEFVRLVESGDEVIVTYEMKNTDGAKGRNTEVLTFKGDQVREVEVYFGWNVQ
jgi:ketosteroid isomerase-like protein